MGCEIKRDENGNVTMILCSRGPKRCAYCGSPSTKLCDGPGQRQGATCDTPMWANRRIWRYTDLAGYVRGRKTQPVGAP